MRKRMRMNINRTNNYLLADRAIDEASEFTQEFLASQGSPTKEVARCRLSVEEVMNAWQSGFGADMRKAAGRCPPLMVFGDMALLGGFALG